ncbi:flavodoxin family protein [Thermosulfurimonas marina]|uniref:Flavodoxin family protein n=1 Tax=Thermosulfurimonas marina TaxID=2047767 RepID=A0A6H1WTV4_9BACT|nr:flavodoxin family protein [Thermosulfurimonas marina]QJA06610.1 flavodoxin family protein [Thermosulfurimonas marina]
MIKVLGILGSPHPFGGSGSLLRCALYAAEELGCRVELVEVYGKRIEPCAGCVQDEEPTCRYPCIFEDEGRKILEQLREAEVYIFATPVYWYAPSGPLKILIDRMTALENMVAFGEPSYVEGKSVGVITVGADAGATLAGAYLLTVLNAMGAMVPPWAHAYSHRGQEALFDDRAVMDAINVGRLAAGLALRVRGEEGPLAYLEDRNLLRRIRERVWREKRTWEEENERGERARPSRS